MHVFCGIPLNEKQIAYWKSLKFNLELKQSQMKTATTMAPNKRLQIARSLSFFCTFIRFCMQKKESDNQKFKISRTQTFSRVISNSKRARTKFKLIGKFKMLRKLKHQKAFPARSLSFFCAFIPFVRKATRKVMIKNSRIWDGTQTLGHQISNSKRTRTTFKLKGKSVTMLRKF